MMPPIRSAGVRMDYEAGYFKSRSTRMKWETPMAVDFRFGMEITMYIANR